MKMKPWNRLPEFMQCDEVKIYYDILSKKKLQLLLKRAFDLMAAMIMLIILAIPILIIAIIIKIDSPGPVLYLQERVTSYGKKFNIHKFRTMVDKADRIGSAVTIEGDKRITKVGAYLRRLRIDEIPQLIDVITGNMSFVGTRPEVIKYVNQYTKEMYATLLLPAGITSEASIRYKDEAAILATAQDIDKEYLEKVLPQKMRYNLQSIRNFSLIGEIRTMLRTVFAVFGKHYE